MLFTRICKKQYYENVFDRENKFLQEFFSPGKQKNVEKN